MQKDIITFTERKAIEQLIDYIQPERGRLWNEYTKAVERLSKLDEIDRELLGGTESRVEPSHSETGINTPEEPKTPVREPMSLEEAIEKHNSTFNPSEELNEVGPTGAGVNLGEIFDREKQSLIDYELKTKPTTKNTQTDVKMVTNTIVHILKEAGVPLKTKQIKKELERRGVKVNNVYSLMQQARGYSKKIKRATHGYYQYQW